VKKFLFLFFMMIGSVYAQQTTPNLITNGVGGNYGQWSGIGAYSQLNGQHPIDVFGCCTSFGSGPFFDTSTGSPNGQSGQFIWSYGQATVQQIIAVNQALSGSGVQINGYNWGYEVRNMNGDDRQGNVDTLTAHSFLKHTNGSVLLSATQTYNTKQEWNWHGGTVTAPNPYALADVGQLGIQFTSMDSGFWGGYYGPQVRNVSMSLNYEVQQVDPCTNNPLHSPSCPGYQQAYHDQQCSANPLYAVTCPGYQAAYYTQQCSINPLYDSGCPGYAQAYFDQQCSLDPLYNNQCPGYQQAYFDQQCSLDPLYNNQCPGYQQAYFNQQCSINGLYDRTCPNYAEAYAKDKLLTQQNNSSSTQTVVAQKTSEPSVQVSSKGEVSTEVQLVADPTVNEVLRDSTKKEVKSSSPAAEVTPIVAARPQPAPVSQPAQKAEQKQEQKKTDTEIAKIENKSDSKDSKDTKSNKEKVKEAATEKAKELAKEMSNATTIEAQAANQGVVLGLMNYNPGFSAYANAIIPDTGAIEMARQYNKPTVDNRRALRALSGASDRLHQQMVDEQYR
jgi:hypothetical protein